MEEEKELSLLIRTLYKVLRKHGTKRVLQVIKKEFSDNKSLSEIEQRTIDFIVYKTLDAYQISSERHLKEQRRGKIHDATKMCYVLFDEHLDITQQEIAEYFDRSTHTVVSSAIRHFRGMDKKIKKERDFLERYEQINESINQFKEDLVKKYAQKQQ